MGNKYPKVQSYETKHMISRDGWVNLILNKRAQFIRAEIKGGDALMPTTLTMEELTALHTCITREVYK